MPTDTLAGESRIIWREALCSAPFPQAASERLSTIISLWNPRACIGKPRSNDPGPRAPHRDVVWRRNTTCYPGRVDPVLELLWDDHNEAHINRHGVTIAEVTSLVFGSGPMVVVTSDEHRTGRREVFGITDAGRHLLVVTEAPTAMGRAYVVTARPMTDKERRVFEEKVGGDD